MHISTDPPSFPAQKLRQLRGTEGEKVHHTTTSFILLTYNSGFKFVFETYALFQQATFSLDDCTKECNYNCDGQNQRQGVTPCDKVCTCVRKVHRLQSLSISGL
ncbi:hypothetical protein Tcan_00781, partial [Toxocara canis]